MGKKRVVKPKAEELLKEREEIRKRVEEKKEPLKKWQKLKILVSEK